MSVYRLDRMGNPVTETEWFPDEASALRREWQIRMTSPNARVCVWLDHATYVPIETCPPAPSLASRIKTRITRADEGIAS